MERHLNNQLRVFLHYSRFPSCGQLFLVTPQCSSAITKSLVEAVEFYAKLSLRLAAICPKMRGKLYMFCRSKAVGTFGEGLAEVGHHLFKIIMTSGQQIALTFGSISMSCLDVRFGDVTDWSP